MRKLLYSPWQTLGVPSALTPIGQLHQSPPSPVPGGFIRVMYCSGPNAVECIECVVTE